MSKSTQLNLLDAEALVATLKAAKKAYYEGKPTMSDAAFDAMEDELRQMDSHNSYFKVVGAPVNSKAKFKHDISMLSAGKTKTPEEVEAWATKMGVTNEMLIAEPKIDGLSASVHYQDGVLKTIATRGDGSVGQDVTHIYTYMKDGKYTTIPKFIDIKHGHVEIRGELYLPKVNPIASTKIRNAAVGLVNRKDHDLDELKHLRFVAYQVIYENPVVKKEDLKIAWLKLNHFQVIDTKLLHVSGVASFYQHYLDTLRAQWVFETDGLIFVVNDNTKWDAIDAKYEVEHHHHYMIALKPPAVGKETTLTGIEWNVSRNGKLIPVGLFDSVEIGGVNIKRATLNNWENVSNLRLVVGDKVFIERANDVIPFFKENRTTHKDMKGTLALRPTACPSCGGMLKIDGVHLVCENGKCPEQQILKVLHWVKHCEMDQFGESSVRALFAAKKIKSISDLYSLTAKDLQGLDSFGDSRIKNTLEQIDATREMTIGQFIKRLGIDGVGERAVSNMEINNTADMWAFNAKKITSKTNSVGNDFLAFREENANFIKELLASVVITTPKAARKGAKKIAMTGSGPDTRSNLVKEIEAKGDVWDEHVAKDTNILLTDDKNSTSSKITKAKKMGVTIMEYGDYFK